jgi:hypothetical protein
MKVAGLGTALFFLAADGISNDQTDAVSLFLIKKKRNSPLYVVSLYVAVLRNTVPKCNED